MDAMTKMANSLNVVNREVWERLKSEDVSSLVELGALTQAVVCDLSVKLYLLISFVYLGPHLCLCFFSELSYLLTSSCGHGS